MNLTRTPREHHQFLGWWGAGYPSFQTRLSVGILSRQEQRLKKHPLTMHHLFANKQYAKNDTLVGNIPNTHIVNLPLLGGSQIYNADELLLVEPPHWGQKAWVAEKIEQWSVCMLNIAQQCSKSYLVGTTSSLDSHHTFVMAKLFPNMFSRPMFDCVYSCVPFNTTSDAYIKVWSNHVTNPNPGHKNWILLLGVKGR